MAFAALNAASGTPTHQAGGGTLSEKRTLITCGNSVGQEAMYCQVACVQVALAVIGAILPSALSPGETIAVRHQKSWNHGYLYPCTLQRHLVMDGDLTQVARGHRIPISGSIKARYALCEITEATVLRVDRSGGSSWQTPLGPDSRKSGAAGEGGAR